MHNNSFAARVATQTTRAQGYRTQRKVFIQHACNKITEIDTDYRKTKLKTTKQFRRS